MREHPLKAILVGKEGFQLRRQVGMPAQKLRAVGHLAGPLRFQKGGNDPVDAPLAVV